MGRHRAKGPGSSVTFLRSQNVIELDAYRRKRLRSPLHNLLYINDAAQHLEMLCSFSLFDTDSVQSMESLQEKLAHRSPDLVLIESRLQWANALDLIAWLSHMITTPIVMVCDKADRPATKKTSLLLKQAFAAGLHDTLFAPLERDEVRETIEVLLKFQRELSLDQ